MVFAVTVLLAANHAKVELPRATVATRTMAMAATSCRFRVLLFIDHFLLSGKAGWIVAFFVSSCKQMILSPGPVERVCSFTGNGEDLNSSQEPSFGRLGICIQTVTRHCRYLIKV